jgi:hypothetical protein
MASAAIHRALTGLWRMPELKFRFFAAVQVKPFRVSTGAQHEDDKS